MSASTEQFERDECCTRTCREAHTKRRRCKCVCNGRWHGTGELTALAGEPSGSPAPHLARVARNGGTS